ncbi:MAG TPA: PAS domain S-box protein [Abditibacteriaceae bacterium]|jgi:PAS domain S-box-containing protein
MKESASADVPGDTADELKGELERGSQWLRSLYERNPNGIFALDREGRFVALNPACQRIMGYAPEELLGRHFFDVTTSTSREIALQGYMKALQGGNAEIRMEGYARDGSARTLDMAIAPLPTESGVGGVLVMAHDITQRLKAESERDAVEAALRASEERYQAFISQSSEAIWRYECPPISIFLDVEAQIDVMFEGGLLVECNDALAVMYGYKQAEEIIGTRLADVMPDTPGNREYLRGFIRSGYRIADAESKERNRNGEWRSFSNNLVGIIEDDHLVRAWGTQRDITERRAAEDALQESEDRYQAFIAQSTEAIWRYELTEPVNVSLPLDEQIDLVYERAYLAECNDAMAHIYGFDYGREAIGRTLAELLPRTPPNEAYLRAFASNNWHLSGVESNRVERDGRTHYYISSLLGIIEGDCVVRAWGTRRDITEAKEAENALRESEQRLHLALRAGRLGTWDWNLETGKINCSPLALMMLGCPTDTTTVDYAQFASLVHPDDHILLRQACAQSATSGELLEVEFRVVWPVGGIHWLAATGALMTSDTAGAGRLMGTCRDITERRRNEHHQAVILEASQEFAASLDLETTLGSVARMLVPAEADWCVIDVLEDASKERRVAVAHTDSSKERFLWHMKSLAGMDSPFSQDDSGQPTNTDTVFLPVANEENLRALWPDETQWASMQAAGLRSLMSVPLCARGRMLGALTMATARSERRYDELDVALAEELARRAALAVDNARLYGEAQTAQREAENANRSKDEFLAVVSHELRTPLTPLLGWIDLINAGRLNEEQNTRALEAIGRNAHVQLQLVNDLLDVSRMISGKLAIDAQRLDWRAPIEAAIEMIRAATEEKKISLHWQAPAQPFELDGDSGRLRQIVANLLTNAVKFTPTNGRIEVTLSTVEYDRTSAVLEVRDSGAGISSEFLPHVWERFRQADATTTRHHGGLGLGLAIVRHLAQAHGGKVEADSPGLGQGTSFRVFLPLLEAESQLDNEEVLGARDDGPCNGSVLLLDDDDDARAMLEQMLRTCQWDTRVGASSDEAFQILASGWKPDVIVSDIAMPGADGFEFLRRVKASEHKHIPVIALTAHAREEDRERAFDAGFALHLAKPVSMEALRDAICQVMPK